MTKDDGTAEFVALRPRLLGIAYRLLGSMWDAEDVVAEAMVRWLRTDRTEVREPVAFLTTVVSRLALDQLRSARVARETYVGPWLPEPVRTAPSPLDGLVKRETLSLATLRLMEQLTPPERAVFVLREAFDIPYAQIAEILELGEGNARQLLHRAQAKLAEGRRRTAADAAEHEALLERFLGAVSSGELEELEDLLAADVVAYSDGGGKVHAARRPLVGRDRVMRFIAGLIRHFGGYAGRPEMLWANGQPAVRFTLGAEEQLVALEVRDGKVQSIFTVRNPDKLAHLDREVAL